MLVCGGREYADYEAVDDVIKFMVSFYGLDLRILHGGARGADSLAQRAIKKYKVGHRVFPADWSGPCKPTCEKDHRRSRDGKSTYCPAAGVFRNTEMADYLDFARDHGHTTAVVAFPGGSGTIDMIQQASERLHPVDAIDWVPTGWDLPNLP